MPQMAPVWWMTLMIMIISMKMMVNSMLYVTPTVKIEKNPNKKTFMYWKW